MQCKKKIKHILQLRHNISVTNICNKTVIRNLQFFFRRVRTTNGKIGHVADQIDFTKYGIVQCRRKSSV